MCLDSPMGVCIRRYCRVGHLLVLSWGGVRRVSLASVVSESA